MDIYAYDRSAAAAYARKWALGRNPDYYDFSEIGGDCTNFASQCLFAGCGVMNFASPFGWFYRSANNRTPSWTGVEYLHNFLVKNDGVGPFAEVTGIENAQLGDLIQLGDDDGFYHSPFVVGFSDNRIGIRAPTADTILIAAHSYDALDKPLSSYGAEKYRVLHILGYRK